MTNSVAGDGDALPVQGESARTRALRHVSIAERDAGPPPSLADTGPADIHRAIVVGGGTMGAGIAWALTEANIAVTVVEVDDEACARARENGRRLVDSARSNGALDDVVAVRRATLVSVVAGWADLPPAELGIEAAFEDMAIKRSVFAALELALPATAVLATTTSCLDLDEIAREVPEPDRVLGLRFSGPPHVAKLLEIGRGAVTGDRALATGFALARQLGKIPVLAAACGDSIGNRILTRYLEAADTVLIDGSTPWEIDEAMVAFGCPMGPYEAQDVSGLDVERANRRRRVSTNGPVGRHAIITDRMVEEGRYGRKTSVGWYRYPGGNGPVIDPLIEDLVVEEARFAKVERRDFEPEEIRDRLVTAMIDEACMLLEEGVAARASDIDLVTVHECGFPRRRGGLMYHANEVGAEAVLARMRGYAVDDPVAWGAVDRVERVLKDGSSSIPPVAPP